MSKVRNKYFKPRLFNNLSPKDDLCYFANHAKKQTLYFALEKVTVKLTKIQQKNSNCVGVLLLGLFSASLDSLNTISMSLIFHCEIKSGATWTR